MNLLFVCTGNLCRSALAERLAVTWSGRLAEDGGTAVRIDSVGTNATAGRAMDESSAQALVELGGDPTGFRSRSLTTDDALAADLVLTMTRGHRRTVIEQVPRAMRRTFTLTEAAALLAFVDADAVLAATVDERAGVLAARLDAARAFRAGADGTDDIADPRGAPLDVHRSVAARIADDLRPVAHLLFAPSARRPWRSRGTRADGRAPRSAAD